MKIGLAITTTDNRVNVFERTIKSFFERFAAVDVLYIHKDYDYRGIVYSKNKCIETLYGAGCTDFFIVDDDVIAAEHDWWLPYVNSDLNHACWNYNRTLIKYGCVADYGKCDYYAEYDKPNGCMLYVKREVIDVVGGFDTDFKGYGYEHCNFSDRIFNNGLTPARYIDIPNSKHLFAMADCDTSVSYSIRASTIPINERLYKEKFYSKEFKPFR